MELQLEDTPALIEAQLQKDVAAKPRPRNEFHELCQNFFNEKCSFHQFLKNTAVEVCVKKKNEFHELIMLEFF